MAVNSKAYLYSILLIFVLLAGVASAVSPNIVITGPSSGAAQTKTVTATTDVGTLTML